MKTFKPLWYGKAMLATCIIICACSKVDQSGLSKKPEISKKAFTNLETQNLSATTLKVLAYNIQGGRNPQDILDLDSSISTINIINADIVGLGEVFEDQIDDIMAGLPQYTQRAFHQTRTKDPKFGNLILSKYPIEATQRWIYNRNSMGKKDPDPCTSTADNGNRQGLLEAKINVNGRSFYFYLSHLGRQCQPGIQTSQVNELKQYIRRRGGPKILVGDFNLEPNSTQHTLLTNGVYGFNDPYGTSLTPKTFKAGSAATNKRIDYILGNQYVTFNSINVETVSRASDHHPVVAEVTLDHDSFRHMQYNINNGQNPSGQYDLNAIKTTILNSGADVVALNQVDSYFGLRSNYDDQLKILADSLHMYRSYHATIIKPADGGSGGKERKFGQAFLSKFPIDGSSTQSRTIYSAGSSTSSPQGLFRTLINVNGTSACFYVTSFNTDLTTRNAQANEAKTLINGYNTTYKVFSGTLSDAPASAAVTTMLSIFTDAFAPQSSATYNHPSTAPNKTINYIMHGSNIQSSGATVMPSQASTNSGIYTNMTLQ